VDPLKPFTNTIRSLWPQTTRRTETGERAGEAGPSEGQGKAAPVAPAQPPETLHGRLRSRMSTLTKWDPSRARQMFVECVLVTELGDHLIGDPAFGSLVQRVSEQLESNEKLSTRLDALLKRVAEGEAVA
jgi:hypothetical protein